MTCPSRRGNRKGVVEKANHSAAQRWWRTLGDDVTIAEAQAGLDRLAVKLDSRRRVHDGERTIVAGVAAAERLHAPALIAFPAEFDLSQIVTRQALVAFRGNSYSVPPGLGGAQVQVRHRVGADVLRIVTDRGATVAVHHRAPDGAGRGVRDDGHVIGARTRRDGRLQHRSALHSQDALAAVGGGVGRSSTTARPARDGARGPRRDRPGHLRRHRGDAGQCTHL
ncbi:Mu transposase domain-containing protein [Amycolatopsis lurida]|uniref:Mu transposase domain-containing protein n=1 Tax=Amycolatopsis lurida TaxID=31959 RepID=UPI000A7EE5CA|nr:hypothetical protein [Amycolatopsis lurida]